MHTSLELESSSEVVCHIYNVVNYFAKGSTDLKIYYVYIRDSINLYIALCCCRIHRGGVQSAAPVCDIPSGS